MDELKDLLESTHNKVCIAEILIGRGDAHLLPTILECLYEDAQKIIDDYCIVGLKENPQTTPPISAVGADYDSMGD